MIEQYLRRFIEYEQRKLAVIILTVLTGLVAVWPAADEYMAARERRLEAESKIAEAEEEIAKLPRYTELLERKTKELQQLSTQTVSNENAQSLRGELVGMVRQSGCKMRRIRLGEPQSRIWRPDDDPIRGSASSDESGFLLVKRSLALSVTGPMANIHQLLSRVHAIEKLAHCNKVAIKRQQGTGSEAAMEIEVVLFDLEKAPEA